MELRRVLIVLLRRWWLVVGLPAVVLTSTLLMSSRQPYVATVRATILIPGDTEATGDAERPELMVLDDAPGLIHSEAFAELVEGQLDTRFGNAPLGLDDETIQASLSAERYSRILTVEVRRDDAFEALIIGQAVATVLPDAVNRYLIPENGQAATVGILDRPEEAFRDVTNRRLILIVQTLVALAVGAGLAAFAAALDQKLYSENIEELLGLPVLADVRSPRRRWSLPLPSFTRLRGARA